MKHRLWILLVLASLAFAGCGPTSVDAGASNGAALEPAPSAKAETDTAPGDAEAEPKMELTKYAILKTNHGEIIIEFRPDLAPKTVENFQKLAAKGFYEGTRFHRVIPGFMIQGGDPNSREADRSRHGIGGPGYSIDAEFNSLKHNRGTVSMARTQDPNSAGSQFFIVVKDSNFLDGEYTGFGTVVRGMEVADKIVNLPRDSRDNPLENNPAIIEKITLVNELPEEK